jgi:pyrroloquinoline quinone biosynthesis protein B
MKVIVLGAAAGGGFPQWNANSTMNRRAFEGSDPNHPRLTQCSLAVSADGHDWVLLNASPDIRQQIIATPELHPREGQRSSPIKAVIVTGADVDAFAGLLILRERQKFDVWASPYVLDAMARNPIFNVLSDVVGRREIPFGGPFEPVPHIAAHAHDLGGKPPLYLETTEGLSSRSGASIAVHLRDTKSDGTLAFAPSCAEPSPAIDKIAAAQALFLDGTMYTDDEMIRSGEGQKTARRMGHMPMTGPNSSIEHFAPRRAGMGNYFIHINNSNPVLNRASPERKAIEHAGWKVAEDGMRIEL